VKRVWLGHRAWPWNTAENQRLRIARLKEVGAGAKALSALREGSWSVSRRRSIRVYAFDWASNYFSSEALQEALGPSEPSGSQQAKIPGAFNRLAARVHIQLAVDATHVGLQGVLGDEEPLSDLCEGKMSCEQLEYLPLH
jgi:hypothetical protein